MKKSLQICQNMSDKKAHYKNEFKKNTEVLRETQEKLIAVQKRLSLVDKFEGLDDLNDTQLEEMEKAYYQGLDMVKNARCQKKYMKEIESLRALINKSSITDDKIDQENFKNGKQEIRESNYSERFNVLHSSN